MRRIKREQDKIFDDVKKDKNEMDDVYYGPNLMSNYSNFRSNLKKDEILKHEELIPTNESKMYYNNTAVKQIFTPVIESGIYRHILSFYPLERMFIDTMYLRLHNSTLAFCNIIDIFSKMAYSKLFIIGGKSQAIKSSQSVETLKGFITSLEQYGYKQEDLGEITIDAGSEFKGDFLHYLNDNKILHFYANAGDKKKTSPIERFNRTLRLYIEKYRVIYGKIDSKVLEKIMTAYNSVSHADLPYNPIEILKDKDKQLECEQYYLYLDKQNHISSLKIGQSVRVLIDRGAFQKTKPIWSHEVYKIEKILNNSNYLVNNTYYHLDELQPINESYLLNDKKITEQEDYLPDNLDENDFIKPKPIEIPVDKRELSNRIRTAPSKLNL